VQLLCEPHAKRRFQRVAASPHAYAKWRANM
jgi:hypothetical protein